MLPPAVRIELGVLFFVTGYILYSPEYLGSGKKKKLTVVIRYSYKDRVHVYTERYDTGCGMVWYRIRYSTES